jgi:hypothetical protein
MISFPFFSSSLMAFTLPSSFVTSLPRLSRSSSSFFCYEIAIKIHIHSTLLSNMKLVIKQTWSETCEIRTEVFWFQNAICIENNSLGPNEVYSFHTMPLFHRVAINRFHCISCKIIQYSLQEPKPSWSSKNIDLTKHSLTKESRKHRGDVPLSLEGKRTGRWCESQPVPCPSLLVLAPPLASVADSPTKEEK